MKKHTRITALILATALVFGCLSLNVFATDEEATLAAAENSEATVPAATGIKSVADIESLAAVGEIEKIHTATISSTASGTNHGMAGTDPADAWHLVEKTEGSDDYYLSFGQSNLTTTGDTYLQAAASKTTSYSNIQKNFDEYKGRSFVVSLDLRLTESFTDSYSSLTLFQFGTYLHVKNTASALRTYLTSIKSDGSLTYSGGMLVNGTAPKLTPGASDFTTVSIFVVPETNTVNIYLDGELYVKDATFMPDPSLIAGLQIDEDTVSTEKDYVPSWLRMFNGTPLSSVTEELLGFDNFKFYYADYFVECAEHDFAVSGEHSHDFENSTSFTAYECTNCSYAYDKPVAIDADGDTKCDACITAVNENVPYHSFADVQADITAQGGSISSAEAFDALGSVTDKAGNLHILGDEWGNNYISLGSTTDASKSQSTYKNLYFNNSVNFSNLKSNETRGKAFVLQMDLRLEEGLNKQLELYQISTYVRDNVDNGATDESGVKSDVLESYVSSSVSSLKNSILYVTADGYLKSGSSVSGTPLSYDEFTTVAVHVEPLENKYSVYQNGVCVIEDVTLFSWKQIDQMTFENADGSVKVEGPLDYILGYWRFFQNSINSAEYLLSADNAVLYYADDYEATYAPKYHEHTLKTVNDEGNGYFTFTYKCGECADVYSVVGTGVALGNGVVITGRSASLGDYIGFKLHAEITDALKSDETAKLVITVGDEAREYELSEKNDYTFTFELSSVEMSETVSAYITSMDGESDVYATSFADYAETLIASSDDEALADLLKSTLTYGAYAQDYFAEKNAVVFESAPTKYYDEAALAEAANDLVSGINIGETDGAPIASGATLILDSTVSIKIFVSADATAASVGGEESQLYGSTDEKYIIIEGIMPAELAKQFTVVFENGTAATTISVSVVDCAALVIENDAMSTAFKNLAGALYVYAEAARVYTEA